METEMKVLLDVHFNKCKLHEDEWGRQKGKS